MWPGPQVGLAADRFSGRIKAFIVAMFAHRPSSDDDVFSTTAQPPCSLLKMGRPLHFIVAMSAAQLAGWPRSFV